MLGTTSRLICRHCPIKTRKDTLVNRNYSIPPSSSIKVFSDQSLPRRGRIQHVESPILQLPRTFRRGKVYFCFTRRWQRFYPPDSLFNFSACITCFARLLAQNLVPSSGGSPGKHARKTTALQDCHRCLSRFTSSLVLRTLSRYFKRVQKEFRSF